MSVEIIQDFDGPHKGWHTIIFRLQGLQWKLLIIDNDDDHHSTIYRSEDRRSDRTWAPHHSVTVRDIINIDTAATIINSVFRAHENGHGWGVEDAKKSFRKAIGL